MDSESKQPQILTLFFCPSARFSNKEEEFRYIQFGELPTRSIFLDGPFHDRPLDWCNYEEGKYDSYECYVCRKSLASTTFYSCKQCHLSFPTCFHKECIKPITKHAYHPNHSLRFIFNWTYEISMNKCLFCLNINQWVYSCSICDFFMCQDCATIPPILAINQSKRHEHTLFFLPRKSSLVCDVCALNDHKFLMYFCTICGFVVHKDCVYLPFIIRISRHEHRLSFSSLLTPEKLSCGVCREKIDTNFGRYSCIKDCNYGVHSKCATREDVWDGKELEGIEEEAYEDIKPFKEISDGVIQHFSHQNHHMRLDEERNRDVDENKRCQACTLHIYDEIIYNCMQCDFTLHQACAHLPPKKQHAMHPHTLSLQVYDKKDLPSCRACYRESNGFMYLCHEKNCNFKIDVHCFSLPEPFNHWSHLHLLFLTSKSRQACTLCKASSMMSLNCDECGFSLCFNCATLPNKLRYKNDEHFLILSYDTKASGEYWCDVCEKETDSKFGVYMCNDCNITLHIDCLLGGEEMYLIPSGIIGFWGRSVTVFPNNLLTRNKCTRCHYRCQRKIVYKIFDNKIVCSTYCLGLTINNTYLK